MPHRTSEQISMTVEPEAAYLQSVLDSESKIMILAIAKECGLKRLELELIEGNDLAWPCTARWTSKLSLLRPTPSASPTATIKEYLMVKPLS